MNTLEKCNENGRGASDKDSCQIIRYQEKTSFLQIMVSGVSDFDIIYIKIKHSLDILYIYLLNIVSIDNQVQTKNASRIQIIFNTDSRFKKETYNSIVLESTRSFVRDAYPVIWWLKNNKLKHIHFDFFFLVAALRKNGLYTNAQVDEPSPEHWQPMKN